VPHSLCKTCRTKPDQACLECALHKKGPALVKRGLDLVDRAFDKLCEQEKPLRPPWGETQHFRFRLLYLGMLYRLGWTEKEYTDYLNGNPMPAFDRSRRCDVAG